MKKVFVQIIFATLSLCTISLSAQPIMYGMTTKGGHGMGNVFQYKVSGNSLTSVFAFPNHRNPSNYGQFMQARDGLLYAMIPNGGTFDLGAIFSFDLGKNQFRVLHDFQKFGGGAYPMGGVLQDADGKLYGLTSLTVGGGSVPPGGGTVFSYDPVSGVHSIKGRFGSYDDKNGAKPYGNLLKASNGLFYGLTSAGGAGNKGCIFSFNMTTSERVKLVDFTDSSGYAPYGSLVAGNDGKLYGMTSAGGSFGYGSIFSFNPADMAFERIFSFDGKSGASPFGNLFLASDGHFYGMTSAGGSTGHGTVFSYNPTTKAYSLLYSFDGTNGALPYGSLVQANDGKLYGLAFEGGKNGKGTIFYYDRQARVFAKKFDFGTTNGENPGGSLFKATDGKLYGMATAGGTEGMGLIFSFDPASGLFAVRHDFNYSKGINPYGSLLFAKDQLLYGMTHAGGKSGYGTIFSLNPLSGNHEKLHDFDDLHGAYPKGTLVQAKNNRLYGMTTYGGSLDSGTLFSYDVLTKTFTKLHDFDGRNGAYPRGGLIEGQDGLLYGVTDAGGSSGCGTIFSVDPASGKHLKLFDFNEANGKYPSGKLFQEQNGVLFGVTEAGGANGLGTLFSFNPANKTYVKLFDFSTVSGSKPSGALVKGNNGRFYGTTVFGPASSWTGTIFSFEPVSSTHSIVFQFKDGYGINPGALILAADGRFYGLTPLTTGPYQHIAQTFGSLFSYNPVAGTQTNLQSFNAVNGRDAIGYLTEIPVCEIAGFNPFPGSLTTKEPSLVLDAGAGYAKYLWSNGATASKIEARNNGVYKVTVTNAIGCTAKDSVLVQIQDTVGIVVPDVQGQCGSSVDIPVKAFGFRKLLAAQGSINWNPNDLRFDSILSVGPALLGMDKSNFGTSQAAYGKLAFAWNDPKIAGVTLPDTTTLFVIRMTALGSLSRSIPVTVTGSPTSLEFLDNIYKQKPVAIRNGKVNLTCLATVTGKLISPMDDAIAGVEISVTGTENKKTTTDKNGSYTLQLNPGSYTLTAVKKYEKVKSNGVSTLDLAMIQSHILYMQTLNSPYKVIAADADSSGAVSSVDIVYIRRMILGLDTSLPGNRTWAFVDSAKSFANPMSPFPITNAVNLTVLSGKVNQTFRAIKLGDVNWDRNPAVEQSQVLDTMGLFCETSELPNGEMVVRVRAGKVHDVMGFQFTLHWDDSHQKFLGVGENPMGVSFGDKWADEGYLVLSWNDPASHGVSLQKGDLLFELRFSSMSQPQQKALEAGSWKVVTEVFDKAYRSQVLLWEASRDHVGQPSSLVSFRVFPNPAGSFVHVQWQSEFVGQGYIRILDTQGRKLLEQKVDISRGVNFQRLELDGIVFRQGIYFIQLDSDGKRTISRLMIQR